MSILRDFTVVRNGNGVLTELAGNGVRTQADSSSEYSNAMIRKQLKAIPGRTYTCTFKAKLLGDHSDVPYVAIDYPGDAQVISRTDLSTEWETYCISFTVPVDANPLTDKVAFVFGIYETTNGTADFCDIEIHSSSSTEEHHIQLLDQPVYDRGSITTLIPTLTLDMDISRVGNVVTVTASTNISADTTASDFITDLIIPSWAQPIRKSTQVCELATQRSYFTAMDVGDQEGRYTFYKRKIDTEILPDSFLTIDSVFSMSYIAQSVSS